MKYELTSESWQIHNHKVYRIRALEDNGDVKAGDLGGWVESKRNLLEDSNAWIYGDAAVFSEAVVSGNALVYDKAVVFEHAQVTGNADVSCSAVVRGKACVKDEAAISGYAIIAGNAVIQDRAEVHSHAIVQGRAKICDDAEIGELAIIEGFSYIRDKTKIFGCTTFSDLIKYGNKTVYSDEFDELFPDFDYAFGTKNS